MSRCKRSRGQLLILDGFLAARESETTVARKSRLRGDGVLECWSDEAMECWGEETAGADFGVRNAKGGGSGGVKRET